MNYKYTPPLNYSSVMEILRNARDEMSCRDSVPRSGMCSHCRLSDAIDWLNSDKSAQERADKSPIGAGTQDKILENAIKELNS